MRLHDIKVGGRYYVRPGYYPTAYEAVVLAFHNEDVVVRYDGGSLNVVDYSCVVAPAPTPTLWRSLWRRLTGGKGGGR